MRQLNTYNIKSIIAYHQYYYNSDLLSNSGRGGEDTMFRRTIKVADSVDGAIVAADRFIEFDANPVT